MSVNSLPKRRASKPLADTRNLPSSSSFCKVAQLRARGVKVASGVSHSLRRSVGCWAITSRAFSVTSTGW
ncbi:Uncharacterised protein [Vibrio cholerae]|nr:Uncharacterised protein [Vibrio cholerae]